MDSHTLPVTITDRFGRTAELFPRGFSDHAAALHVTDGGREALCLLTAADLRRLGLAAIRRADDVDGGITRADLTAIAAAEAVAAALNVQALTPGELGGAVQELLTEVAELRAILRRYRDAEDGQL